MGLYNKSFNKLDINLDELKRINVDKVTNSLIYRYKDLIIKKYWYCTEYAITDEVFDILCTIDNSSFIKLYEMFTIITDDKYEEKYSKFLQRKSSFSKDGYTAKYYQIDSINPLLEYSSYLINSIESLKELVEILSNYKIMMSDTKIENTIINKNGIIIIDPDYYELSNQNIEMIKNNNYKELLQLLNMIFIKYARFKNIFNNLDDNNPFESICYIEKELKKVKRPIDLF